MAPESILPCRYEFLKGISFILIHEPSTKLYFILFIGSRFKSTSISLLFYIVFSSFLALFLFFLFALGSFLLTLPLV